MRVSVNVLYGVILVQILVLAGILWYRWRHIKESLYPVRHYAPSRVYSRVYDNTTVESANWDTMWDELIYASRRYWGAGDMPSPDDRRWYDDHIAKYAPVPRTDRKMTKSDWVRLHDEYTLPLLRWVTENIKNDDEEEWEGFKDAADALNDRYVAVTK
jgi:hypothetical protein